MLGAPGDSGPGFAQAFDLSTPNPLLPPDLVIECNQPNDPSHTGVLLATDTCATNLTVSYSDSQIGSCTSVITRTWTATDDCGQSSVYVQTITLVDTVPPLVNCPATITVTNAFAPGSKLVFFTNSATDACDAAPALVCTPASGSACSTESSAPSRRRRSWRRSAAARSTCSWRPP